MYEYPTKQISKNKPLEVTETSYNVQVCTNIIQLPDGTWQYDRCDYTLKEYAEIKQREKDALLETITNLKTDNKTMAERLSINESTLDAILTDILPTIQ